MSKNKGAVLIPQSQLTDEELEQVAGGLLPAVNVSQPVATVTTSQPLVIGLSNPAAGMPAFIPAMRPRADDCGTSDSGAMGCPG